VQLVLVAPGAVLLPLDALGMQALVLGGEVIPILALAAGENDLVAWHGPSWKWDAAVESGAADVPRFPTFRFPMFRADDRD
jgi:hypothetical protein